MKRGSLLLLGLSLALLGGCASEDLAHTTPIARSNVLKPEFTQPRAGTAHLTVYREPENSGKVCDAVVQVSFHDVPGGRIADVAKLWPDDRLDIYLDPGHYRLNVYSAICGEVMPVDVDVSLKAGEALTYKLFTGEFNMSLTAEPAH
ncbi:MAG TPA: hypothetical protein VGH71_09730 [Gammaproteobacteria bacterium]|jgi:hypothetical protein